MAPTYASAGGSATVGTNVSYIRQGASVKSSGTGSTSSTVYIPITNPQNTTDKLTKVTVESKGTSATVKEVYVYFGDKLIYDFQPNDGSSTFSGTPTSTSSVADADPYGIDVSLDIDFTSDQATYEIYSVTLQFGS